MQPNMNGNVMNDIPQATPVNPGSDVVFRDKPKKNTGMIIGMVVLALLAAGGIGFGVWAYLSGNQKSTELNNKISELNSQISTLNDELNNASNNSGALEIGECIYTSGTEESGATLQCEATLNEEAGTLTYDSVSNTLKFVYNATVEVDDETDVTVETDDSGQEVVEEVNETTTE